MLRRIRAFWRSIVDRDAMDLAMDEEFALHLDLRTQDLMKRGMSPEEAARRARVEFGSVAAAKETARATWGAAWLDRSKQDVRYTLRLLRHSPGFTAVALLSLGGGIGATTTIFSVVDAVDFRPLPFRDASRLVWMTELTPAGTKDWCPFCPFPAAPATASYWATQLRSIDEVAAIGPYDLTWQHDDVIEYLPGLRVTTNLLPMLGVQPERGRLFAESDAAPGAEPVMILSHDFWRTRLGGDTAILGARIGSGDEAARVIGVLPPDFEFRDSPGIWKPLRLETAEQRSTRWLTVMGRLAEGHSITSAAAEIRTLQSRLAADQPEVYRGWGTSVKPLREWFAFGATKNRLILLGFTTLVLLIAVFNVAGLLLARAIARAPEFALRTALGASRRRLVGQMVVEGACIGLGGGLLGLVFAAWAVRITPRWMEAHEFGLDIGVDARMLLFGIGLSIIVGITASLAPALRVMRLDPSPKLSAGGRATGRMSGGLVMLQVAMAIVLLTAAGLLARDFVELRYLDLGYDPDGLYTTNIRGRGGSADLAAWRTTAEGVRARAASTPGVVSASLEIRSATNPVFVRPADQPPATPIRNAQLRAIDAGFFATFGTPLVGGRSFTADDQAGAPNVAIVNEAAAAAFWPGQNPLGKRLTVGDTPADAELLTVVGVVRDMERGEMIERHWPMVYRPFSQAKLYRASATLHLRLDETARAIPTIQRMVHESTGRPSAPLASATEKLREQLFAQRVNAIAFQVFSAFGLLLAAMGIYGTAAYAVTQRMREIGIRLALGAQRAAVMMLVARRGLLLAASGALLGVAGALALARVFGSIMVGTSPMNPWIYFGAAAVMVGSALVATFLPARRAARADAVSALRAQ